METESSALDRTLHVLASPTRRAALRAVDRRGETSRAALARELAGQGQAVPGQLPADADGHRIEAELHHVHLPKLDAVGLLEYDAQEGTVQATGPRRAADDLLECLRANGYSPA